MSRFLLLLCGLAVGAAAAQPAALPEIHCKHFFYGYPAGTPATDDLVIRDAYALASNDSTRFADWVAYRLTPHEVFGWLDLDRAWRSDPWLDDDERLEATPVSQDDYRRASTLDYDRGHLAPLASFRGVTYASEVNFYSNIVPQLGALNQGPWRVLEEAVRDLVLRRAPLERDRAPVWIVTGPLYERFVDPLPNADEPHRVPSGFWKIVAVQDGSDGSSVEVAAFLFDQETPRTDHPLLHLVSVSEVEVRSGLDFFRLLPDDIEFDLAARRDPVAASALLFPED